MYSRWNVSKPTYRETTQETIKFLACAMDEVCFPSSHSSYLALDSLGTSSRNILFHQSIRFSPTRMWLLT